MFRSKAIFHASFAIVITERLLNARDPMTSDSLPYQNRER